MPPEIPEIEPPKRSPHTVPDSLKSVFDLAISSGKYSAAGLYIFNEHGEELAQHTVGELPDTSTYETLVRKENKTGRIEINKTLQAQKFSVRNSHVIFFLNLKDPETSGEFTDQFFKLVAQLTPALEEELDAGAFRNVVENIGYMIFELDEGGDFLYINPTLIETSGYDKEQLLSMNLKEVFSEEAMSAFNEIKEKNNVHTECNIRIESEPFLLRVELRLHKMARGNRSPRILGVAMDISERKENEQKLIDADQKLSQYKEGLKLLNEITSNRELSTEQQIEGALGICTEYLGLSTGIISDVQEGEFSIKYIYSSSDRFQKGQKLKLSDTFSELVYSKEEILAVEHISNTTYMVHPAHETFKIESYIGVPYFVGGKKKGTIAFSCHTPRKDKFDHNEEEFVKLLARWIGFMIQNQEFEHKMMADKMILQAFVSSAPAAIAMLDKDMRYITASDKWYQDYAIENEYIIGKKYFDIMPESGQDWKVIFQKALQGSMEHNDQDLIETEEGEIQWIKWEVRPWFERLETVGGLIIFTEDITQQKEQQLQLKIAKRRAEQASKAKEQFLSTMSHEIRTPLNAIIGMTEVMLMDDLTDDQVKHLNLLKFSGENLLVLINDILDFNKIEAGKLELEVVNFNLKQILEKTKDSMTQLVNKKGLEFNLNIDPELPDYVKGDPVRLGQVINNLVNNAIKFTDKGYINVDAKAIYVGADSCTVDVKVTDSGIGIPEDKLETIFQSFQQANARITRKYGGSGLGLSISRKILALMNSSLEVESKVGQGSTFFFRLELKMGDPVAPGQDPATLTLKIRKDLNILVAEDNEGNRVLIQSLFKRWGINHTFAHDGLEAIEKISSKEYDMVLMDLQMPEMDGYEATINIRNRSDQYFKDLPIVALTASVMSNVLEKAKEVGMNAYVSKPFDPKYLREVIATHTGFFAKDNQPSESEIISQSSIDGNDFPYLKELIGDDPESLREVISTTVQSVKKANKSLQKAVLENNIDKVRAELHVLRPNLHNLELGNLINDFPSIRELNDESIKLIHELTQKISGALNSPRLTIFA